MLVKRIVIVVLHVLFWLFNIYLLWGMFGIQEVYVDIIGGQEVRQIKYNHTFTYSLASTVLLGACLFYINTFFLLKHFFMSKHKAKFAFRLLTAFLFVVVAMFVINPVFFYPRDILFPSYGLHITLLVIYLGFSFLYGFVEEWQRNEDLKRELAEDKLKTELTYLKSQVNPHFLFNTLNNLYSMAQDAEADDLASGIARLARLMRYMIYESSADTVPLSMEINLIQNYIEIQKLRFHEDDNIAIEMDVAGSFAHCAMPPMLLLPFVENAFKHGISLDQDSTINILLKITGDELYFTVGNTVHHDQTMVDERYRGLGLANVKKRLQLLYGRQHSLEIQQEGNFFTVKLVINLNVKN